MLIPNSDVPTAMYGPETKDKTWPCFLHGRDGILTIPCQSQPTEASVSSCTVYGKVQIAKRVYAVL